MEYGEKGQEGVFPQTKLKAVLWASKAIFCSLKKIHVPLCILEFFLLGKLLYLLHITAFRVLWASKAIFFSFKKFMAYKKMCRIPSGFGHIFLFSSIFFNNLLLPGLCLSGMLWRGTDRRKCPLLWPDNYTKHMPKRQCKQVWQCKTGLPKHSFSWGMKF